MFMDVIRLPHRTEDLGFRQIQQVNRLRRPLIDDQASSQHATNRRVKRAMADGLPPPGRAGCWTGAAVTTRYSRSCPVTLSSQPSTSIPRWSRRTGRRAWTCHHPDDALMEFEGRPFDAVVSVFVFHFRLPAAHIDAMAHLGGFVLANVYRRDEESRRRLERAFRARGLEVTREVDPAKAATGHEFWFIARPRRDRRTWPTRCCTRSCRA